MGMFSPSIRGSVTGLSGLLNKSSEEKRFLFVTLRRFLEHNRIHEDGSVKITAHHRLGFGLWCDQIAPSIFGTQQRLMKVFH